MSIPAITVEHLTYQYPDGRQALEDISFRIMPGEKVALLGANGAGKSTLLLHLNGILRGSGKIHVNGVELTSPNLSRVRGCVGMIFQNPEDQLFSTEVYGDVAYGPYYQGLSPDEIEQRVSEALAAVNLRGFSKRSPYHLSGGEKKRVAIATVLSMRPSILVFDEPSAGLDPRGRRELIQLLEAMPQTMLIATHDLDMAARLTSRLIVLNQGKIVADEPAGRIISDTDFLMQHGLY